MRLLLVHGAYHGSWCWDRLVPELRGRGHATATVDLPISDPGTGAKDYADAVAKAAGPDTVLVAHSMGGLVAPLVAERQEVAGIVFIGGLLPEPGISFNEQRERDRVEPEVELDPVEFTDLGDGVWMIGGATATQLFFHDLAADVAAWAVERLRPQSYGILSEVTPLGAWPAVAYGYVVCRDDRTVSPEWGRRVARERLGVDAVEIDGGHSPFLSRPAELADLIDGLIGVA